MKKALAGVALVVAGVAAFVFARPSKQPEWTFAARSSETAPLYPGPLISQSNPSACGPTSLANVWASADAGTFQSPCPMGFCMGGLTLDELAAAAQHPGWKVTVLRDLTLEQFREELTHVSDRSRRYVINFHRGPIFGTGGGHHSPLADVDGNGVLVLDVNASYGPWRVSAAKLFEAMDTVDPSSGKKRGLLRIELN